jgi:hypothetical protein
METTHSIDVMNLDPEHLKALEDVIGAQLQVNQRLLISVTDAGQTPAVSPRSKQSISDWTGIYSGLTDEQIEAIDRDVNKRADLTRHL